MQIDEVLKLEDAQGFNVRREPCGMDDIELLYWEDCRNKWSELWTKGAMIVRKSSNVVLMNTGELRYGAQMKRFKDAVEAQRNIERRKHG